MDPEAFTFGSSSDLPNGKKWRSFRRHAKVGSDV
jgi:hypothetical protein